MEYTQGDLQQLAAGVYKPTEKVVTFDGSAGNGAVGTVDLFKVTGRVLMALIAVCDTTLVGATATLEAGVSGAAAKFLAQVTATNIAAGDTMDVTGEVAAGTAPVITPDQAAINNQTIQATVGTADITAGKLAFYLFWRPLSTDGNVTVL